MKKYYILFLILLFEVLFSSVNNYKPGFVSTEDINDFLNVKSFVTNLLINKKKQIKIGMEIRVYKKGQLIHKTKNFQTIINNKAATKIRILALYDSPAIAKKNDIKFLLKCNNVSFNDAIRNFFFEKENDTTKIIYPSRIIKNKNNEFLLCYKLQKNDFSINNEDFNVETGYIVMVLKVSLS